MKFPIHPELGLYVLSLQCISCGGAPHWVVTLSDGSCWIYHCFTDKLPPFLLRVVACATPDLIQSLYWYSPDCYSYIIAASQIIGGD